MQDSSYLMFDEKWFLNHQRILLWLLNFWPIRRFVRYLMRIRPHDIPLNKRIVQIGPNRFSFDYKILPDGRFQLTTNVRTHRKYSKRIYYSLKPLWLLLHTFDMIIANRFKPAWNLGFDELTEYPDAGTGGDTVDGRLIRYVAYEVWADARAAATATTAQPTTASETVIQCEANITGSMLSAIARCAFLFDTTFLGDISANVSAGVFSLYSQGSGDNSEASNPADLALVSVVLDSDSNMITSDYALANWGTSLFADVYDLGTFIASSGYKDMTLNSTGLAAVGTSDLTRFGVRGYNDVTNSEPTARSYGLGYFADQTGISNDPKLVLTYTSPYAWSDWFEFASAANVDNGGGTAWNNPTYALADDANEASGDMAKGDNSDDLRVTNPNPGFPDNATIMGIEVRITRRCEKIDIVDFEIKLVDESGNKVGDNQAVGAWTVAEEVVTFGGMGDVWGWTPTPSKVNNSNHGVSITVYNNDTSPRYAYVDYVEIRYFYQVPVTGYHMII